MEISRCHYGEQNPDIGERVPEEAAPVTLCGARGLVRSRDPARLLRRRLMPRKNCLTKVKEWAGHPVQDLLMIAQTDLTGDPRQLPPM